MSELPWIAEHADPDALPPADRALRDPNGLLAAGGRLTPEWILRAYQRGIFPWFEEGQPILWWSPDPRTVLLPGDFRVSRSLRRTIARHKFTITADTAFSTVISACAGPRSYTDSTWITGAMERAFNELHLRGWAHSFEAWQDRALVGGLYGVAIGRVFFGESMFTHVSDASKTALAHAVHYFMNRGIELIDCQVHSSHLASLGATTLPRREFLRCLEQLCARPRNTGSWTREFSRQYPPA
jgi:leucyl/phenylalanyl-tRNA--protein transferase